MRGVSKTYMIQKKNVNQQEQYTPSYEGEVSLALVLTLFTDASYTSKLCLLHECD